MAGATYPANAAAKTITEDNINGLPVRIVDQTGASMTTSAGLPTKDGQTTPKGFQQITALGAVVALTPPAGATIAVVVAETSSVRWRDDGVAPTASVGMLLAAGTYLTFTDTNLAAVQFIQTAAGAVLDVAYYA